MFYICVLLLVLGRTMVFYSLSPYYSALGLVMCSILGCIVLGFCGVSFIALLLLLVYVGGMLVVFIYSNALSADRYPVVRKLGEIFILFCLMSLWVLLIFEDFLELGVRVDLLGLQDLLSLRELYNFGGFYLLIGGLALLVVLVVALVVSFSFSYGSLRAL